jgi:hypothetical protein
MVVAPLCWPSRVLRADPGTIRMPSQLLGEQGVRLMVPVVVAVPGEVVVPGDVAVPGEVAVAVVVPVRVLAQLRVVVPLATKQCSLAVTVVQRG